MKSFQSSNLDLQNIRPFDASLVFDLLSNELLDESNNLKFVSWSDFDKALESDTDLYKKLKTLARDEEIIELKKFLLQADKADKEMYEENSNVVGRPNEYHEEIFHKYVPIDSKYKNAATKFNNNEVYLYRNDKKSDRQNELYK